MSEVQKIVKLISNLPYVKDLSWIEILAHYADEINKKAFTALVSIGFFDGKGRPSRNAMLYEYDIWKNLSDRETDYIKSHLEPTENLLHHINVTINNLKISSLRLQKVIGFKKVLEKPTRGLQDTASWIAQTEDKYLGVAMTCAASDMVSGDIVDTQCKEVYQGIARGECYLGVTINTIRDFIIKKEGKNQGKKMAFLSVSDNSAILDSVIMFPDTLEKYKPLLYENNTVVLFGQPSQEKNGGFIVNKVFQI
jgi:DNA polymerase III alpha subunit